jgi:hypothetical protein
MTSSGDLDINLALQSSVISSIEQQNLATFAKSRRRRTSIEPPRPVLEILHQFAIEQIATQEGDPAARSLSGLTELAYVLRTLLGLGHKEFRETLKLLDAGFDRIARASRERLVAAYLSPATPPDEVREIQGALIAIIRAGGWPGWRAEFDALVEGCCSPSISPRAHDAA